MLSAAEVTPVDIPCHIEVADGLGSCSAAFELCARLQASETNGSAQIVARFSGSKERSTNQPMVQGELRIQEAGATVFVRRLEGTNCGEIVEGLVLAHELAGPSRLLATPPGEHQPDGGQDTPSEYTAGKRPGSEIIESASSAEARRPSSAAMNPTDARMRPPAYPHFLGLGIALGLGDLPDAGLGIAARFRTPYIRPWAGTVQLEQRWASGFPPDGPVYRFSLTGLTLALAHSWNLREGLWVAAEAGPSFTLTHVDFLGTGRTVPAAGLTAGATIAGFLAERVVLELRVAARWAALRNRFSAPETDLWTESWLSGTSGISIGWVYP